MKLTTLYVFLYLITLSPSLIYAAVSEDQMKLLEQLPPDQRASILQKMESASSLQEEIEETFEDAVWNREVLMSRKIIDNGWNIGSLMSYYQDVDFTFTTKTG